MIPSLMASHDSHVWCSALNMQYQARLACRNLQREVQAEEILNHPAAPHEYR